MAKFCSLYSSSSGNCTYIGTSQGGILVDVGISAKRAADALCGIGVDPSQVAAIFITHEHADHINGVRVFAKKFGVPVYASAGTLSGMQELGALDPKIKTEVIPASGIEAAGIFVRPFVTPHDSRESCGYTVELPHGQKAAIATDIGKITPEIEAALHKCELVMLESNHDISMLQAGPYPYYLKRRILSDVGHLSNESCAEQAKKLIKSGTTRLFLGHLSDENNFPDLAFQTTLSALSEVGAVNGRDYILQVNKKENADGVIRF